MAVLLLVLVNVFVQFVTLFYYTEGANKSHLCGVHSPAVSRGIYRERDLPAADSQIRHTGTSAGIKLFEHLRVAPLITSSQIIADHFYVYLLLVFFLSFFLHSSEMMLLDKINQMCNTTVRLSYNLGITCQCVNLH